MFEARYGGVFPVFTGYLIDRSGNAVEVGGVLVEAVVNDELVAIQANCKQDPTTCFGAKSEGGICGALPLDTRDSREVPYNRRPVFCGRLRFGARVLSELQKNNVKARGALKKFNG